MSALIGRKRLFEQLATARLLIRRFSPNDAPVFAEYRSDPGVARYQEWDAPYTLPEARRFIARQRRRSPGTAGTWFQFAVCLADTGALIGDVALHTTQDKRQGELGFTFAAASQGNGYATEAVRAIAGFAFGPLGFRRLYARTDERNVRAQRLLERVGFRREAVFREATWFKGAWATDLVYAQLKSEWENV